MCQCNIFKMEFRKFLKDKQPSVDTLLCGPDCIFFHFSETIITNRPGMEEFSCNESAECSGVIREMQTTTS